MSGIVLAIAFLMSVWASDVFTRTLRNVPSDNPLYALVHGALEAQAIGSGGVRIFCAAISDELGTAGPSYISPAASISGLLNDQAAFRAEVVPGDATAVTALLDPKQAARPDAVIVVGTPPVLADAQAKAALDGFVRQGGFVLVYGSGASEAALSDLLPATPGKEELTVSGAGLKRTEHLAAQAVAWQKHPQAILLATEGKPGAESLATLSGKPLIWVWSVGEGTVAWYPLAVQSMTNPDVISWFLRGEGVQAAAQADPRTSLLVKLVAYGCRQKLEAGRYDRRGIWLVALSLMVCVVGITNAMLMSVTERFREIGTMKCLGALDRFVVKLFLIESSLQGVVGSLLGALIGLLLAFVRALFAFHVRDLEKGQGYWLAIRFFPAGGLMVWLLIALGVGIVLSVIAAIYPALRAARMQPVQAMRVEA
jgi:hypothetical protein